jgi:signal-transduction protein with cAMP-binding, CBS, and nucleotidyltransferase domain
MELMKRIRHLPVLENNAVLGVISMEMVKSIIEIQKRNNSVFDSYISGKNHNKE